jgi:hypothetical protein
MTTRELNRATLARQMLLARERRPVVGAVEQLLAMQAQLPRPPFAGLWCRLEGFTRADLVKALTARTVVRGTSMRGTIHLMSAADFLKFRGCLQPGLDGGMHAILKERAQQMDIAKVLAHARAFLETPHNFEEVRDHLMSKFPGGDDRALGYVARMSLPLLQVPSEAPWAFDAQSDFVNAETWIGKRVADCKSLDSLVLRYLQAYGPATSRDAQAWLGLSGLDVVFERLGKKVVTLKGAGSKAWYDLPDAPRPAGDTPAPVRFIPEWDSVVVTRADERVVAKGDRPCVFLPGLRIAALVLVDGFAAGAWKVTATAKKALLTVECFRTWPAAVRKEVEAEGHALLRFAEPAAASFDVKIAKA